MSAQLFLGKAQVSTRPALFLSKFEEIKNPILKIDVISNSRLKKSFYVNKFLKCGKVQLFTSSKKGVKNLLEILNGKKMFIELDGHLF